MTILQALGGCLRCGAIWVRTKKSSTSRLIQRFDDVSAWALSRSILSSPEQTIDTTTLNGRSMFNMLGAIAGFETHLRWERQLEGIVKAKAEGRYKGRP